MDQAQLELETLMNTEQAAPTEAQPSAPAQPTVEQIEYYLGDKANKLPINAQFAFNENGKTARVPLSTIINNHRQASNFQNKFQEFNQNRSKFEEERRQWGDLEPYRQLQKWSVEKPQEFQAIWELYQNKDKNILQQKVGDPNSQALIEELSNLKQKLGGLEQFKSQFDQRQEAEEDQRNIAELNGEVEQFKKEFPEVNLDQESDILLDSGQKATLKQAIMLFGYKNRIPDFESAALKYLKPKLLDVVAQRARNDTVKGVKGDKAAGVISRSSQPTMGQSSKVSPKSMSWNDANKAAKAELETLLRG